MTSTSIGQDSITILEKKIKKHGTQLDDLTEEFAANDEGEIELRDIHPLMMDALKVMQIEIESANRMQDLVVTTLINEFLDYIKQTRKLGSLSALVLPLDIMPLFVAFIKKNLQKLTIVDLIAIQQKLQQQKQSASQSPKKEKTLRKEKTKRPADDEDEEYGYEEYEEEMEEEMDEEQELEQPAPPKKQPTQRKEQSPVKKQETKKAVVEDKAFVKDKVEATVGDDDKKKPEVAVKEEKKADTTIVKKQETLKKQPTTKVQQVKVDEKEEQAKKMLFEEKQEKQWAAAKGDEKGLLQSPVKKNEVEEDENLFHGKDSPVKKQEEVKDSKKKDEDKSQSDHETLGVAVNKTIEKVKILHESDKIAERIRQLTSVIKLQADLDPNYFSHETMKSLISEHQTQLFVNQASNQPLTDTEDPDFSKLLLTSIDPKYLVDPLIQDALTNLSKQLHLFHDQSKKQAKPEENDPKKQEAVLSKQKTNVTNVIKPSVLKQVTVTHDLDINNNDGDLLKQKEFKLNPVTSEDSKEIKGLEKQATTKIKKQVTIKEEPTTTGGANKEQDQVKRGITKKGDEVKETIKEEGPNESHDDLDKDDVISKIEQKTVSVKPEPKIEMPSIKLPIVNRAFEKGLGPKMQVSAQSEGFGTVRIKHHKAFFGIITYFKAHAVEKVMKIIKIEKEPLPASPPPQSKTKKIKDAEPVPEKEEKKEEKTVIETQDEAKEEGKEEVSPVKDKPTIKLKKRPETARSEKEEVQQKEQVMLDLVQIRKDAHRMYLREMEGMEPVKPIDPLLLLEKPKTDRIPSVQPKSINKFKPKKEELSTSLPAEQTKIKPLNLTIENPIAEKNNLQVPGIQPVLQMPPQKLQVQQPQILSPQQPKIEKVMQQEQQQQPLPTGQSLYQKLANKLKNDYRHTILPITSQREQNKPEPSPITKKVFEETIGTPTYNRKQSIFFKDLNVVKTIQEKSEEGEDLSPPNIGSPFLKLPHKEDKGNYSDTSPSRIIQRQSPINARHKLVKAIQMYEKLLTNKNLTYVERSKMIEAVEDLKDQLISMDKTSIHQEELKTTSAYEFDPFSVKRQKVKLQKPESKNCTERSKPQNTSLLQLKPTGANNNIQDLYQNEIMETITLDDKGLNYDENAKKTILQMKDICAHYSKQNISIKTDYTFEDIKEEQGLLNMNKVIAFLQDFDIQVNPQKVAELYKKTCHQRGIMFFEQFKTFMEQLYMRKFDADKDTLKRKLLSINFKIKKIPEPPPNRGMPEKDEALMRQLNDEKAEVKKQIKDLTTLAVDINQIYKQIREDLWMDGDKEKFYSRMRGYIPEYEKLPKLASTTVNSVQKPKQPKSNVLEEILQAAEGVPKIPQFFQLQEILKKDMAEEMKQRQRLREISRTTRKAMQSVTGHYSPSPASNFTLETIKKQKKLDQSMNELIDNPTPKKQRNGAKSTLISKQHRSNNVSPRVLPEIIQKQQQQPGFISPFELNNSAAAKYNRGKSPSLLMGPAKLIKPLL